MRIIGGKFKGRRIEMPVGADVRPTPDRVREAIFNIIKTRLENESVLDLFAGSGALGIEALSRGASYAMFVDIQKRCIEAIKKNIERLPLGPAGKIKIYQSDSLKAIKKLSDSKIRFGLVFLDPPYYSDWVKKCLLYLHIYDILKHSSLIICEHFKKDTVPEKTGSLVIIRRVAYGDTALSFYTRRSNE